MASQRSSSNSQVDPLKTFPPFKNTNPQKTRPHDAYRQNYRCLPPIPVRSRRQSDPPPLLRKSMGTRVRTPSLSVSREGRNVLDSPTSNRIDNHTFANAVHPSNKPSPPPLPPSIQIQLLNLPSSSPTATPSQGSPSPMQKASHTPGVARQTFPSPRRISPSSSTYPPNMQDNEADTVKNATKRKKCRKESERCF